MRGLSSPEGRICMHLMTDFVLVAQSVPRNCTTCWFGSCPTRPGRLMTHRPGPRKRQSIDSAG